MFRISHRLLSAVFFAGSILAVPLASAATRYVATAGTDSDNDCLDSGAPCRTIQYAVEQANAGDTISIGGGTYAERVDIRLSLVLIGAGSSGAGKTTVAGDGENGPGILVDGIDTEQTPVVTIQDMDVSGNSAGDGIDVQSAQAMIVDSVVSGNSGNGIDISAGDAEPARSRARIQASIQASAQLTITSTVVSDNTVNGIEIDDDGQATINGCTISRNGDGGVIIESGSAAIGTSTLDGNTGAGVVADGSDTEASLTDSTVSNTVPFTSNQGDEFGGGVLVFPGGIATIDNSTLFGNAGQGILVFAGAVSVSRSTINGTVPNGSVQFPAGGIVLDNEAPGSTTESAGGSAKVGSWRSAGSRRVQKRATANASTQAPPAPGITLAATIVAKQATTIPDCAGAMIDGSYNLDSDGSCSFTATGSKSDVNPLLGPLANNGGPTLTLLPAGASPAVDAIPAGQAGCVGGADDQRGVSRPQPSGGGCDIGAVEVRQVVLTVVVGAHGSVTANSNAALIGSGIGSCSDTTCSASYESEASGPQVILNAAPAPGWSLASATGCGGGLSGGSYTTAPIAASCTVQVVFAQAATPVVPAPSLDDRTLLLLAFAMLLLAPLGLRRR